MWYYGRSQYTCQVGQASIYYATFPARAVLFRLSQWSGQLSSHQYDGAAIFMLQCICICSVLLSLPYLAGLCYSTFHSDLQRHLKYNFERERLFILALILIQVLITKTYFKSLNPKANLDEYFRDGLRHGAVKQLEKS